MNDNGESQEEVLSFLGDPKAHGGQPVRRIDTHAASVFLSSARALKIKRSVRFPFLDYSTLAKRKQACEAELAVNAPFAPEIYRRVVAITRETDGRLAIAGKGVPVEWAVEMHRFDESRTLDHLASAIDEALADALGRAVAAAHVRAQPVDPAAWIAAVGSYVDEHAQAFQQHPEIFARAESAALAHASRAAYRRLVPLLQERGRRGLIGRIHGDLHLGNIVLIDGKPVLFDAIEFSDIIASGDALYDLAFLLMDLLERGLAAAANVVLNRYLAENRSAEDLDGLATLPFFLSMRAAIRAEVTAARMERASASERAAIANAARAYFTFAGRAVAPPKPKFIAIGGLSGTGKTRLARALAPQLGPMPGAVIVRSDLERKALFGIAETDKLPPQAYAPAVNERVYALLLDKARRILGSGHAAIIDAVFAQPHERQAIAAAGESADIGLQGLFLTADLTTRLARVGARAADASDADAEVARAQESYDLGSLDWRPIDAAGTVEETAARARAALD
jgi:aminoglycoside phosphotransferase family enzyme/predicted kinase